MKVFLLMVLDGCALSVRLLDIHNNRHGYLNHNRTINILRTRMRKGDAIFLMGYTYVACKSLVFTFNIYTCNPATYNPHMWIMCESCMYCFKWDRKKKASYVNHMQHITWSSYVYIITLFILFIYECSYDSHMIQHRWFWYDSIYMLYPYESHIKGNTNQNHMWRNCLRYDTVIFFFWGGGYHYFHL